MFTQFRKREVYFLQESSHLLSLWKSTFFGVAYETQAIGKHEFILYRCIKITWCSGELLHIKTKGLIMLSKVP